jgi:hypothetical protein
MTIGIFHNIGLKPETDKVTNKWTSETPELPASIQNLL